MDRFRRVCILSGCDYLPKGLPGVGLTKAVKFFSTTSNNDLEHVGANSLKTLLIAFSMQILRQVPDYLNLKGLKIEDEYVEAFRRAEYTFLHQIVFDPRTRQRVPLNAGQ